MRFHILAIIGGAVLIGLLGRFVWLLDQPATSLVDQPRETDVSEPLDPRLEAMTEFRPRCRGTEGSYAWICGSVIRLPGPHLSQVCTSQDEPLFVGSLSLPNEEPFFGNAMSFNFRLPLSPLTHCSRRDGANIDQCAGLLLSARTTEQFGYRGTAPPDPLPADLPPPPYDMRGHQLAPKHFAELDGRAVALFFTRLTGPGPSVSPDRCTLAVRLSELNVGIDLRLACTEMASWRTHLRSAITSVMDGVVSSNPAADCGIPPEGAIILGNRFERGFRKSMPRWLDLHR